MIRRSFVVGFGVAALVSGIVFFLISQATVVPMVAHGSGPNGIQVTTSGWVALALSLFSTLGFGGAAGWIAWIQRVKDHVLTVVPDAGKPAVDQGIDEAVIRIYQRLYQAATDPDEKKHLREAAKLVDDAEFAKMFPLPASPAKTPA